MSIQPISPSSSSKTNLLTHSTIDSGSMWKTIKSVGYAVKQVFCRPLIACGFDINPFGLSPVDPSDMIDQIKQIANQGLEHASRNHIFGYPQVEQTHTRKIEEVLLSSAATLTAPITTFSENNVTRAIPLETRIQNTDWVAETNKNRDNLALKSSNYITLLLMSSWAGIVESDGFALFKLSGISTKPEETRSLWQIFINKYGNDLSWFKKFKAGLIYWTVYKFPLIPNIINTYLKSFIDYSTHKLTNSTDAILKVILDNVNDFLLEDLRATKEFAASSETGSGGLEELRQKAIDSKFRFDLPNLCKKVSAKFIDKSAPHVTYFKTLGSIPIVGRFFKFSEWVVNRFILSKIIKYYAPQWINSLVSNGLQTTENQPFKLALTDAFLKQIENYKGQLSKQNTSESTTSLTKAEKEIFSTITIRLKKVLALEGIELEDKLLEKLQKNKKGYFDEKMDDTITESIVTGCKTLTDYLSASARSSEFTARILELACSPFSDQSSSREDLDQKLDNRKKDLQKNSQDLFDQLITININKAFSNKKPEAAKEKAKIAFKNSQVITQTTLTELSSLCNDITRKIDQSLSMPQRQETNIHKDLISMLEVIKVFVDRKEFKNKINALDTLDKHAIWRELTPILRRAEIVTGKVLELQKSQDYFPTHAKIENEFKFITQFLTNISHQFHANPRHIHNSLNTTLQKSCEEISKHLGPRAKETVELTDTIHSLASLSDIIVKEQQILDALYSLSPPRHASQRIRERGLLEQLYEYGEGTHPRGFQPKICIEEIDKLVAIFPANEERELRGLIGNGSRIKEKWPQLSTLLSRIHQDHFNLKSRYSVKFNEIIAKSIEKMQTTAEGYATHKNNDHSNMKKLISEISDEIQNINHDVSHSKLNLPLYISSRQFKWLGGILGATIGSGALEQTTRSLGLASKVIWKIPQSILYMGPENVGSSPALNKWTFLKTGVKIGALFATPYFLPQYASTLSRGIFGAYFGWNIEKIGLSFGNDIVRPKIEEIFHPGYNLFISPRIYRAAFTRLLVALSKDG